MRFLIGIAGLSLIATAPLAAAVLTVRTAAPGAELEREGKVQPLNADIELAAADVLRSADTPLMLQLGRRGFVQVGAHTHLQVLQRPFARYAEDLSTVLALHKGGLRLVWRPPPGGAQWPLAVQLDGLRLAFEAGEYFIEAQPPRLCISSGGVHHMESGERLQRLSAGACHALDEGSARPFAQDQWSQARTPYQTAQPAPVAAPAAAARTAVPTPKPPQETTPPASRVAPAQTVTAAPAVPGASAVWRLNIASHRLSPGAEQQAAQLRAAGYAAQVEKAQVNGESWYRVRVPGGASREAARRLAAEIEARFGYVGIWLQAP